MLFSGLSDTILANTTVKIKAQIAIMLDLNLSKILIAYSPVLETNSLIKPASSFFNS